jgi:hypothetical protein
MKRILGRALRRMSEKLLDTADLSEALGDLTAGERDIVAAARPYTMTSVARLASLVEAVNYCVRNRLPGDIAECGVWRGGSMMTIALTLLAHGDTSRHLWLYDTYEGMSEPTARDTSLTGESAAAQMRVAVAKEGGWCAAGLDEVREHLHATGYPRDRLHFVQGKVEETIPAALPGPLALLRLDTDWYESTRHELQHLYPLLVPHGVLVIDDYGHWQGARQAVDEYFANAARPVYLHRIDYTGRLMIRPGD